MYSKTRKSIELLQQVKVLPTIRTCATCVTIVFRMQLVYGVTVGVIWAVRSVQTVVCVSNRPLLYVSICLSHAS